MQDCPEEFDQTKREAMFAFRTTDLGSNDQSSAVIKELKHWSLVVHFPRGKKTYLFEAGQDKNTGLLQATRTENVDTNVFDNAMYMHCGPLDTCPRELLDKAKKVSSNGTPYNLTTNNCQTWLKEFLQLISPKLFKSFQAMWRANRRSEAAKNLIMILKYTIIYFNICQINWHCF